MFGLTQDRFMAMVRQFLPMLGSFLAILGYNMDLATWTPIILEIAGVLFVVGSATWSWFANGKKSIIASAASMPEVKSITVNNPELANVAKEADPSTNVKVVD